MCVRWSPAVWVMSVTCIGRLKGAEHDCSKWKAIGKYSPQEPCTWSFSCVMLKMWGSHYRQQTEQCIKKDLATADLPITISCLITLRTILQKIQNSLSLQRSVCLMGSCWGCLNYAFRTRIRQYFCVINFEKAWFVLHDPGIYMAMFSIIPKYLPDIHYKWHSFILVIRAK